MPVMVIGKVLLNYMLTYKWQRLLPAWLELQQWRLCDLGQVGFPSWILASLSGIWGDCVWWHSYLSIFENISAYWGLFSGQENRWLLFKLSVHQYHLAMTDHSLAKTSTFWLPSSRDSGPGSVKLDLKILILLQKSQGVSPQVIIWEPQKQEKNNTGVKETANCMDTSFWGVWVSEERPFFSSISLCASHVLAQMCRRTPTPMHYYKQYGLKSLFSEKHNMLESWQKENCVMCWKHHHLPCVRAYGSNGSKDWYSVCRTWFIITCTHRHTDTYTWVCSHTTNVVRKNPRNLCPLQQGAGSREQGMAMCQSFSQEGLLLPLFKTERK